MSFICPTIQSYLKTHSLVEYQESRLIDGSNASNGLMMDVVIRYDQNMVDDNKINVDRIMDYIEMSVRWISRLANSVSLKRLGILLQLVPIKKIWCPEEGNVLGKCQVNSGETDFLSSTTRQIRIWRIEDWSKVLLHELFHAFDWDRFVSLRRSSTESEAVIELMALVTHCLFLSPSIPHAQQLLMKELEWSLQQYDLLSQTNWIPEGQTAVKSYYLLKTALLYNYKEFVTWINLANEEITRSTWRTLVDRSFRRLNDRLKSFNFKGSKQSQSCFSLRMVYHQLSLNPKRKG